MHVSKFINFSRTCIWGWHLQKNGLYLLTSPTDSEGCDVRCRKREKMEMSPLRSWRSFHWSPRTKNVLIVPNEVLRISMLQLGPSSALHVGDSCKWNPVVVQSYRENRFFFNFNTEFGSQSIIIYFWKTGIWFN